MSAKNRLRIHDLWAQNRLSKRKSLELNTHEAFLCLAQSILVTRAQPHIPEICLSTLSVNLTINEFRGNHNTSENHSQYFTLNTGEILSNYFVKLSLSPHKSSHGTFLDSLTVDLFKIPHVNQRLKRRHTTPAFNTIFYEVFDLVRSQHEFSSCLIDFNPRIYFVRPKTCYFQQQSSQYPI